MSHAPPSGIIPAMVSPVVDGGDEIDELRARSLTKRMIASGVHGLFVCSSTGEAPLLSRGQRLRLAAAVAEENAGRLPLMVGVGAASTREAMDFTRDALSVGADFVVALPMHFWRVGEAELERYFASIADAAHDVPTLLYNFPALTNGQNISPSFAARLARAHHVVGIKDSSGDAGQALRYMHECGPEFAVFTGSEILLLTLLTQGGAGAICAVANVFPQVLTSIFERARSGDLAGADTLQRRLVAVSAAWSIGTMPAPIKCACRLLGWDAGPPLAPVQALCEADAAHLQTLLAPLAE